MDRRVDWQTTVDNLIKQYGNGGKILPILLLLWRRWLLKYLVIWVRQHGLRLIRDRFIAGHESCDLRRYMEWVPPDTPLRDIKSRRGI